MPPDDGSTSADAAIDNGVTASCIHKCFAFTVTGSAAVEQVIMPLSLSIPANAVYRKYINNSWNDFDESAGDFVSSAPGTKGDCGAVVTWMPGLNVGYFCVRLPITDGGHQ